MSSNERVRIDQIVHGYDRGHRELARSLELSDEDRATMLVMSDLLVDQGLESRSSYLSCYPLRGAARHVLARTWSAGPNFRPGSVWTHSLLIDYQALAQIADLAVLATYLKRPARSLKKYEKAIYLDSDEKSSSLSLVDSAQRAAIAGIYGDHPQQIVRIPAGREDENESVALALWRQAWPGLRRDFAFLSCVAERSVQLDAGCVLHFTAEPLAPLRWNAGLEILLEDLPNASFTSLRQFLGRYAVENSNPRSVASKLAIVWGNDSAGREDVKIAALAELSRSHNFPRLRRDLLLAQLKSTDDGASFDRVVSEFGGEKIDSLPNSATDKILSMTENRLSQMLASGIKAPNGTLARHVADKIIMSFDAGRLASIADKADRLALVSSRPELALHSAYWPTSDVERSNIIRKLPADFDFSLEDALETFGPDLGPQTAEALIDRVSVSEPVTLLNFLRHDNAAVYNAAAALIANNDDVAAQTILAVARHSKQMVEAIANLRISSPVRIQDPLPWIRVGLILEDVLSREKIESSFAILILTASIKFGGAAGLDVAKNIFEPIFSAIKWYRLQREQERWLDRELPVIPGAYSLRSRLAAAALIKWPPKSSGAGALLLCGDSDNAREIVSDAEARCGRSKLIEAATDSALPPAVVEAIRKKLQAPRYKYSLFD